MCRPPPPPLLKTIPEQSVLSAVTSCHRPYIIRVLGHMTKCAGNAAYKLGRLGGCQYRPRGYIYQTLHKETRKYSIPISGYITTKCRVTYLTGNYVCYPFISTSVSTVGSINNSVYRRDIEENKTRPRRG